MQLILFLAAVVLQPTLATLFHEPSQLPRKEYDYVVVGAGVGGSVVANRLTEDGSKTVLLVEAGPNDEDIEFIHVPFLASTLSPNTALDWNFTTIPLPGLDNRTIPYPRGFALGGSSSINYMAWTRGTSDNYDSWANLTGDQGWSWDSIKPLFEKIEALVPPADKHNISGQIDPSIHGTEGAVEISVQGFLTPADGRVITAAQELKEEFPFNLDMNSGDPLGLGWSQVSAGGGQRDSAAVAYLRPALDRSNLDILVNTCVTKLLKTGDEDSLPVFRGVQITQSETSDYFTVHAKREVILSAGAVGTPQLLMLSGIGDTAELARHGIAPLVALPDVGKNAQDHVLLPTNWAVNASDTLDDIFRNQTRFAADLAEWRATRAGPFAGTLGSQIAWARLPDDAEIFESVQDPSPGPHTPHYELIFSDTFQPVLGGQPPATGHYISVTTALVTPTSRGSITLSTSNPFDAPLINTGFLTTPFDVFTIRAAVKAAQRFMSAPVWDGYILGQFGAFQFATTDAEIDAYARATAGSVFHLVGTASMSARGADAGVLDPDLKVKGVRGLRVVDASIFPTTPTGHTQAPTYVVGERASELILEEAGATVDSAQDWGLEGDLAQTAFRAYSEL
ncbi:hypothetical protein OF83DRAFT_1161884 [Amylostereum chailletii]|nr:hypothetical protein OF83DRAFT_1161884 [Amylostereum chailletii]